MPEPMFERLYREATKMNWQPTEVIQRQGRRRAVRQRVALAAGAFAAVVLVATTAAVLSGRLTVAPIDPGHTTPPSTQVTTSAPAPVPVTTVPVDAMLQPADTGIATVDDEPRGEDWVIEIAGVGYCPTKPPYVDVTPVSTRSRSFSDTEEHYVLQTVAAFPAGDAERKFAWLRGAVLACASYTSDVAMTVKVLAESFAGDASMLVEVSSSKGRFQHLLVREGNLLTEVEANPPDQTGSTVLGQRAAEHLCRVTRTC
jgi:hypothetical protein